jgi:hypothetical protein
MLRRSTGLSDDTKRVGVVRGIDTSVGETKRKCVAVARLRSLSEVGEASSNVVGTTGLSEAID